MASGADRVGAGQRLVSHAPNPMESYIIVWLNLVERMKDNNILRILRSFLWPKEQLATDSETVVATLVKRLP